MTLRELIRQLEATLDHGATDESPIVVEGYLDEEDDLIQASVDGVDTEARCEDGPQGVYINLSEITIG